MPWSVSRSRGSHGGDGHGHGRRRPRPLLSARLPRRARPVPRAVCDHARQPGTCDPHAPRPPNRDHDPGDDGRRVPPGGYGPGGDPVSGPLGHHPERLPRGGGPASCPRPHRQRGARRGGAPAPGALRGTGVPPAPRPRGRGGGTPACRTGPRPAGSPRGQQCERPLPGRSGLRTRLRDGRRARGAPLHPPHAPASPDATYAPGLVPLLGFVFDTSVSAVRMVTAGVLERHPKLTVILGHLGGTLPYLFQRLDNGYRAYPELRRALPHPPSHYLRALFYDTVSFSLPSLQCALSQVGPERLLLGTDYPHVIGDMAGALRTIEALGLPETGAAAILGGTARRVFRRPGGTPG